MKYMIFLTLFASPLWAKPLVLISYFDSFNRAPFNNSERIAKVLEAKFNIEASQVEIKLCSLSTVFDKAFAQTEECLKALTDKPVMVIALGESTCQLKVETMMRNKDQNQDPDNAGVERRNSRIIPEATEFIGLRYPLPQMYCALSETERSNIDVSNNAGSFVCNNTAFQMTYHYPEIQYGFIHVPANSCNNLKQRSEESVVLLEKMILQGAAYLASAEGNLNLPHSSNEVRLPTKKDDLKKLRRQYEKDHCLQEYLRRSKGADERRSIFSGVMN